MNIMRRGLVIYLLLYAFCKNSSSCNFFVYGCVCVCLCVRACVYVYFVLFVFHNGSARTGPDRTVRVHLTSEKGINKYN